MKNIKLDLNKIGVKIVAAPTSICEMDIDTQLFLCYLLSESEKQNLTKDEVVKYITMFILRDYIAIYYIRKHIENYSQWGEMILDRMKQKENNISFVGSDTWITINKYAFFYRQWLFNEKGKLNISFNRFPIPVSVILGDSKNRKYIVKDKNKLFKPSYFTHLFEGELDKGKFQKDVPFTTPKFDIREIVDTNITAKQYEDAFAVLAELGKALGEKEKDFNLIHALRSQLVCISYGIPKYVEFTDDICLLVQLWWEWVFTFLKRTPRYAALFATRKHKDNEGKDVDIDGLTEGEKAILNPQGETLALIQAEYHINSYETNLIDYMELQLMMLKNSLQKAKSAGVKLSELSLQTGISMNILKLL